MNDFFDLDAPLFRFLTRVADMVILSLLWLIGSLPLFTLGISSTALYYAVNKSLIEDRGTVSEEFFRAYRRSFRQATLSFLALAVPESILLADCFMTHYLKGQQAATGNLWIIFTVLSTCGLAWMIYNAAYAARFDDPVKKTVLQSGAMALLHFDKSLLRGAGDMKMFTIANLVNLSIRVIFAVTMAPRFGIQMVWCAVPIGWFSNWLISFLEYRTGKWRKKAVAFSG